MAKNFYKTIKKIGEFFGLDKKFKDLTGTSDEDYKKSADFIENNDEKTIDDLISGTNTGTTFLKSKDKLKPLIEGTTSLAEWAKGQIEASTGDAANETNKEIADKNLEFQREKFEYDKALQQEIFQREDTANQRTVNDMRMAGLNPLNMQGTNGAGNVVATSAPHNDFQMQSTQGLQIMDQIFNTALSAKATASNNSLQQANANLLNAQAENQRIKNIYESDVLAASLTGYEYDNKLKDIERQNKQDNYWFNRLMGWTENMPDWLKQSSARFGYIPFQAGTKFSEWNKGQKDPFNSYYTKNYSAYFYGNQEISQQLLSDELLQGTLGIFGNVLKLLFK